MKKIVLTLLSVLMLLIPVISFGSSVSKTYNIQAKEGYRIVDVKVNGVSQGAITSYTFTNIKGTNRIQVITEKIEEGATTYTVTFNANGGTGTMNPQTFTQGVAKNLSTNTFTKQEYAFLGWATSADGEVVYTDGASYTASDNITLYAVWGVAEVPTLATENGAWYTQGGTTTDGTAVAKSSITSIALVDNYTPGTVLGSWDASKDEAGTITAYLEDDESGNGTYKITIAGNGAGKIGADTSCLKAFAGFGNVSSITGLNILDTSDVTDMNYMFGVCSGLTSLDVSGFATSNVTDMSYMFINCSGLTSLNVSSFATDNVTNMNAMFYNCSGLTSLNVSNFDTGNVTNMRNMFYGCTELTSINVSDFDTSKVTDMINMFYGCTALTSLNVSNFDTSNVTNMYQMFYNCSGLTSLNVSNFDTGNVTNMNQMFYNCSGLTSINASNFDTSKVTNMSSMFSGCTELTSIDVSGFDTSNVTDMSNMFLACRVLTSIDVSSFNTSKVTNMSYMFCNCYRLTTIYASDLWNIDAVTSSDSMFQNCYNLVGGNGTSFSSKGVYDKTYAVIDKPGQEGYLTCAPVVLSSLEVGSVVYLNENGSPVEYLVVNQGIPESSSLYDSSCDGTWLLRKDLISTSTWGNTYSVYQNSGIHTYLNGDFLRH